MTFLNPFVLFGLVAAGVPILIHLLQLRKLKPIEFSSIRFLKEIQHASAKRVKLRDYLLLLLRSLAIASLVFAFARPALKGIGSSSSKTASVVVIDDSPSTTARNEYGEIFSQLKNTASGLVNRFKVGDNVDLIFTSQVSQSGHVDSSQIFSTINPHSLLPLVFRAEPSNIRVSYGTAIEAAVNKLRSSNYINKEIYLLGDLQRTEFDTQNENGSISPRNDAASFGRANLRLFLLQTNDALDDNLSISSVKLSDPVIEVNTPSEIQATIVNNGGAEKNGVVASLYLENRKVAQSVTDLPAGSSRNVSLAFSVPDGGFHRGIVEIDDNSVQRDNKFYFSFFAIKKLNVLIVTSNRGDDFVRSAVSAIVSTKGESASGVDTSTSVVVKVVSPDQFAYTDLSNVDVAIVEEYSASQTGSSTSRSFEGKLSQFARHGGGVILFGPSASRVNLFNELLGAMNLGTTSGYFSSSSGNFLSIDKIDAGDEFFSGLFSSKESADQVKSQLVTKISDMAQIEPNPFVHVLMSTSYGPFLTGREVGRGFAFVFSSQADSSSSNFPMSPFFPVVVQRALFYSAAVKYKPIQVSAGQEADYTYSLGGIKSAILIAPDGSKSEVVPNYFGGSARFTLHGLDELGTYSLTNNSTFCEVSVNIDPRESDLSKASRAEMVDFAKRLGFEEKNVFLLNANKNAAAEVEKLLEGQDLSSFFAGAALLFLILEVFVSKMRTF
jgi:hypothetical protein